MGRLAMFPPGLRGLMVTEAVPGARPRPANGANHGCGGVNASVPGRVLRGVYEEEPTSSTWTGSPSFRIADLKLDAEILWRAAEDVKAHSPSC